MSDQDDSTERELDALTDLLVGPPPKATDPADALLHKSDREKTRRDLARHIPDEQRKLRAAARAGFLSRLKTLEDALALGPTAELEEELTAEISKRKAQMAESDAQLLERGELLPESPIHPLSGEAVPAAGELPEQDPHSEALVDGASREERLGAFLRAHTGTTLADIKHSADVYTPEFQDWRNNRLKQESKMSGRVEDVLRGTRPLMKKPRKLRTD